MVLIHIEDQGLDVVDHQDMDAGKKLKHPPGRGVRDWLTDLVGEGLLRLEQRLSNAIF